MDDTTSRPSTDEVNEYMRHVGRTLYEIIRDWVQEQQALKANAEYMPPMKDVGSKEERLR